ncbi:YicC/YloC family endoribonuclease [Blochmannia endosymbiont of Camponotus (Colobopsis) obliquus]|uniref:YicC/YloC family endoribonuclease n=1 Tax=Blochmannia endosymbiont of Camponotus (Colobopsis) obliquus TaxID=1505597 RepID=UPI00061A73D3|nr:YicC/YloC family endoribonuclease [Blochmannia endosymbiont of Camponotus (Colobopsis) obliquus]AKC60755.1 UPF0701 protein [Blochmannia endosymbiont of Camponotus (Colobopsis) obliquus]
MVYSMTAFTKKQINNTWGSAVWEIRSVNQRYLNINIHLPEEFYELKNTIHNNIKKYITRGKIDCILQLNINHCDNDTLEINNKLLSNIINLAKKINKNNEREIDPFKLLSWPGILVKQKNNSNNIQSELLECFNVTINDFIQIRAKEGFAIKDMITKRLFTIKTKLINIQQEIPKILIEKRKQLLKKIENIQINFDTNKLEQELFYFIQRIDIAEEIDRLNFYIQETQNILSKHKPIGRKLEFLIQELNREINTLVSKSNSTTITMTAIEIKVLIEQIREQIQNIE